MNNDIRDAGITLLLIIVIIGSFISLTSYYQNKIDDLNYNLNKTNIARIKAENKPCCQLVQERYIDKRLSDDGLSFIYEEHPKIVSCE